MQRVVIVGAGLGGLRAAEQLRAAGHPGEIVVLGDELVHAYNRPPLSKEALRADTTHEALAYRHKPSVADVQWRLGDRVTAADLDERRVILATGEQLSYDALVAATGVSARRLPLPVPLRRRHTVRTIDNAARLGALLQPGRRVVILGAGFIGCEVAASARASGCDVTVVELAPVPMLGPLGELLGRELQRRHERHDVRFQLGTAVTGISGADGPREVTLADGTRLPADVVVEAVGSVPNVAWLDGNRLDLADGVRCDNRLAMGGRPDAVAVGDVARFPNPLFDDVPRRIEHWSMPTESARRAARTVIESLGGPGDHRVFAPIPTFWSDQYDIRLQSFGIPALGRDDVRILDGDLAAEVAVGYHAGGRLVGVVLLGMGRALLKYRTMIATAATAAGTG